MKSMAHRVIRFGFAHRARCGRDFQVKGLTLTKPIGVKACEEDHTRRGFSCPDDGSSHDPGRVDNSRKITVSKTGI